VVRHAERLDLLARSGAAVNDDRDADDLRTRLTRGLDRGDRRAARGRGVLEDDDATAPDVRALDAALQAVRLALLADDERVDVLAAARGRVQHRRGHRVRTQRQATHGVDLRGAEPDLLEQVQHEGADQRCGAVVQRDAAQVHVVVGLAAARERDLAVHHGEVTDELEQLVARGCGEGVVGHGTRGYPPASRTDGPSRRQAGASGCSSALR